MYAKKIMEVIEKVKERMEIERISYLKRAYEPYSRLLESAKLARNSEDISERTLGWTIYCLGNEELPEEPEKAYRILKKFIESLRKLGV